MADSNSQAARCPCGFWGSPQTLGLCSKCYRERQQADSGTQNLPSSSATSSNGAAIASTTLSQTIASIATKGTSSNGDNTSTNGDDKESMHNSPSKDVEVETVDDDVDSAAGEPALPSMPAPKEPSPGSKRDASEVDPPDLDQPVQKNKKRCFKCNCKLELAIRELGRCRCDYIFCRLHRLPEQHDCIFDHKQKGREEARNKMVSPKKHMGTTLKRIDSDS